MPENIVIFRERKKFNNIIVGGKMHADNVGHN